MDPATIGASVVALLSPYVADAGKQIVKAVGEEGVNKTKELLQWLRQKFAADPAASEQLKDFEQNPEEIAEELEHTVATKARDDQQFMAEITTRMKELQPVLVIIQKYEDADGLTGLKAKRFSGRTSASVTQEGKKGRNITGGEFEDI